MRIAALLMVPLLACTERPPPSAPAPPSKGAPPALAFTVRPIPLPGATGPVSLDYLACDRARGRVFIPAGGTGSVDVLDVASGSLTRIEGFPTAQREVRGTVRVMGPSSASIGDGVVYVGSRATSEICAIDQVKLVRGACLALPSPPDGVAYVAATKELWVTMPRDQSLAILDAASPAKLAPKANIKLEGAPEGYAVDDTRGLFFTNLEDKNKTLVIDTRTRDVTATWDARCGNDGPRGLAIDPAKRFVFVACTDHVEVLDAARDGRELSKLDTGAGVDNIDYLPAKGLLYVAAGKAAALTVARVDDKGLLSIAARVPTSEGTRVVVVDASGNAIIADPAVGRVLLASPLP